MTMKSRTLSAGSPGRLVTVACVLMISTTTAAQSRYVITDVGSFEGAASEAYAINRYGQVVGRAPVPGDHPYAWHWENGEIKDVGQTTHFHHRFNLYRGEAFDVSDGDQIVGGGWNKIDVAGVTYYVITAFITRPATQTDFVTPASGDQTTDLGTFSNAVLTNSVATGISNNNHVVGWSDLDYNTNIHAFLVVPSNGQWYRDQNADGVNDLLISLGSFGGTNSDSAASGVNDSGYVVGWSSNLGGEYHAFIITPEDTNADGVADRWVRDTTPADGINDLMIDLGTLGGDNSWARTINNFGVVVGEVDTAGGDTVAFRIVPEDTNGDGRPDRWYRDSNGDGVNDLMQSLGSLGGNDSSATGINANGQIVGWAEDANFEVHGFIWENGVMTDLNTSALSASRWGLRQARGINDSGEIVGIGEFKDATGTAAGRAFSLRIASAAEIAAASGSTPASDPPADPGTPDPTDPGDTTGGAGGTGTEPDLIPIEDSPGDGSTVAGENTGSTGTTVGAPCGAGASFGLTLALAGLIGGRRRMR